MKYQLITPTVILKVEVEELKKVVAAKEQKLKHRGLALFQEAHQHKVIMINGIRVLAFC
jgi:hypothetical protein